MSQPKLSFAAAIYDRTLPLYTGEVTVEGVDFEFATSDNVGELFGRVAKGEFDAAEFSFSEFVSRMGSGNSPYVALPAFLSRNFRHSLIFVNRQAGIAKPTDLEGRRVGTATYTIADMVWVRAILQRECGVDLSRIKWVASTAGFNRPLLPLLKPVAIENDPSGKPLTQLLEEGEIDALVTNVPGPLRSSPRVELLFPNFHEMERAYYRRTRIFPILHIVVMRRTFYQEHPGAAASFYKALCQARERALQKLRGPGALPYMLPWLATELAEIDHVFGGDPWPYGVEANRPTIEAFVSAMVEQGMIAAPIAPEALFLATGD